MRIVGGELSGRRFSGPKGSTTRPSPERLREALASALEARGVIDGAKVLDLFAGTGAVSFELLSRGAASAVAVERTAPMVRSLDTNAASLGLKEQPGRFRALQIDLFDVPGRVAPKLQRFGPFDLVFADPPYADVDRLMPLLASETASDLFADPCIFALEYPSREHPALPEAWEEQRSYRYGDSAFLLATRV